MSSLRRGHANLLCIVPILTDDSFLMAHVSLAQVHVKICGHISGLGATIEDSGPCRNPYEKLNNDQDHINKNMNSYGSLAGPFGKGQILDFQWNFGKTTNSGSSWNSKKQDVQEKRDIQTKKKQILILEEFRKRDIREKLHVLIVEEFKKNWALV